MKKPEKYKNKSKSEIKKLAKKLYENKIFTSKNCEEKDIPLVFMAFAVCPDNIKEWMEENDIVAIYEEISKALPPEKVPVEFPIPKGYPVFPSYQVLDRKDYEALREVHAKLLKMESS